MTKVVMGFKDVISSIGGVISALMVLGVAIANKLKFKMLANSLVGMLYHIDKEKWNSGKDGLPGDQEYIS
jgi:hypothetical protein